MANIYDVARLAGVSITTVSHVLNGTRYVSDETKARVLAAVEQLEYRPSSLARAMVLQETRTIALIVPDNVNPFFAELARGIEDHGFEAGYSVMLCNSGHSLTRERAYLEMLVSKCVDGIIYMTEDIHTSQLQPLLARKIPIVVFDREYEQVDAVLQDNAEGGYEVARHLIELGHQRIACICGPDLFRSHDRYRGYEQAMQEAGLAVDPTLVAKGDWSYQSGMNAARQLLRLPSPPSAIFAFNDSMALGVISLLFREGVRVPEDVSVAGYDDITLSSFACPPLTSWATPILEVGQRMCELLLSRINRQLPPEAQRILVRGQLLVRSSTAAPKG